MDKNKRDTHFQGFAKAIMPELDSLFTLLYRAYAQGDTAKRDTYSQRIETLLARRAYDLAVHLCSNADVDPEGATPEMLIERIPDLTEFPA